MRPLTYALYEYVMGVAIVLVLIAVPVSAISGYLFDQDWSGVNQSVIHKGAKPKQDIRRTKTLWDWMQLLAIPAGLAATTILFNQAQDERNRQLEDRRRTNDLRLEEKRKETELEIQEQHAQDAALHAYLDRMGQLLATNRIWARRGNKRAVALARAQSLTVLAKLGGNRKRSVIQFLYEANLISRSSPVISLRHADLSNAQLGLTGLIGVSHDSDSESDHTLVGGRFNLSRVDLSEAVLSGADLTDADLQNADLSRSNLFRADLSGADLRKVDLRGAIMPSVTLTNADLAGADLTGAKEISVDELEKHARSLAGATLPDGSTYGAQRY